jgi:DNA topoisomerase-1
MSLSNKTLIIVESASKCKKIEEYLGYSYKCIACFGHIREIKDLKSIDFSNNFTPIFNEISTKKNQINKLKKEISLHKEVILATDNDREGEAIAWHICDLFELNIDTTKRIIFNEITYNAIQNAIKNPIKINMNLVNAQIARQILDLIIGFKVTPILWKYVKQPFYNVLSAGRCQTPALRIIYDNQIEIDNYESNKEFLYKTFGYFSINNIRFSLQYDFDTSESLVIFLEKSKIFEHIYNHSEIKSEYRNPPEPLITSSLQQELGTLFNISPKETMNICQKLYEQGYITYMRTDSKHYSYEFITQSKRYIINKYGEKYFTNNISKLISNKNITNNNISNLNNNNKDNKNDYFKPQEAHEAIRPTNIELIELPNSFEGTTKERKVYNYIWERTIKSLMSTCLLSTFISSISSPIQNIFYTHKCEKVIFDGWRIISSKKLKQDQDKLENNIEGHDLDINDGEKYYDYLLNLKNGSLINYIKIHSNYTLKSIKQHHNESNLVKILEQKGIGRPSTFSTLVDKLQKREYVKKQNVEPKIIKCIDYELREKNINSLEIDKDFGSEKYKLIIQPIGNTILSFLINNFSNIFEYDYTKKIEEQLDEIAKGNKEWYLLCKECDEHIISLVSNVKDEFDREKERIKREKMLNKNKTKDKNKNNKEINNIVDIDNMNNDSNNMDNNINNSGNISVLSALQLNNPTLFENKLSKGIKMGKYDNEDLFLKKGRYGLYAQWGDKKKSLNGINIEHSLITYSNIVSYINNFNNNSIQKCINEINKGDNIIGSTDNEQNKSLIRILNETASIRNGKYGDYIFYKPKNSTKPEFISLKKYKGNYRTDPIPSILDWIDWIIKSK